MAIDATVVHHFECPPDSQSQCLRKTSSHGVTSYSYHVLEAKLVSPNGMVISLASEWIANEAAGDYQKQDCEHKAFKLDMEELMALKKKHSQIRLYT